MHQFMTKEMIIKSNVDNLRYVEKFVDEVSEELHLSQDVYGNLLIATLEAVNNAIIHGNKKNEDLDVEVEFSTIEDHKDIVLTVKDQGEGFDFLNIPDPTAPENIEKINGRGVFLMEKLSDEIAFEGNGSVVKLKFKSVFE